MDPRAERKASSDEFFCDGSCLVVNWVLLECKPAFQFFVASSEATYEIMYRAHSEQAPWANILSAIFAVSTASSNLTRAHVNNYLSP